MAAAGSARRLRHCVRDGGRCVLLTGRQGSGHRSGTVKSNGGGVGSGWSSWSRLTNSAGRICRSVRSPLTGSPRLDGDHQARRVPELGRAAGARAAVSSAWPTNPLSTRTGFPASEQEQVGVRERPGPPGHPRREPLLVGIHRRRASLRPPRPTGESSGSGAVGSARCRRRRPVDGRVGHAGTLTVGPTRRIPSAGGTGLPVLWSRESA